MPAVVVGNYIFICNQGGTLKYMGPPSKLSVKLGADQPVLTLTSMSFLGAGVCTVIKVAPTPCVPAALWVAPAMKLKIQNQPVVSISSKLTCARGGMISIVPIPVKLDTK